ncbi:preprotein translocase subunit SecA [Clostridioides difficile]|nr:preprotein translocase subunit SecA [Clostridioides difficile]
MWSRSVVYVFFFQAEDGIRDAQESRGLGDVYKRQIIHGQNPKVRKEQYDCDITYGTNNEYGFDYLKDLSLIHI